LYHNARKDPNRTWTEIRFEGAVVVKDGEAKGAVVVPVRRLSAEEKHVVTSGYVAYSGYQAWFVAEKLHRDGDLPAEIYANGSMYWYNNGLLHRDGDLPAIVCADGRCIWYKRGEVIRQTP